MHPNKFSLIRSIEELEIKRQHHKDEIDRIDKSIKQLGYYLEMQKDIQEHEA